MKLKTGRKKAANSEQGHGGVGGGPRDCPYAILTGKKKQMSARERKKMAEEKINKFGRFVFERTKKRPKVVTGIDRAERQS